MPQPGQIIPHHLHPHSETYINDNTEFKDEVAPIEEGPKSIHVFVSNKGRDGVLLPFTSGTSFIKEYGKPNFAVHGQPIYNAYAFANDLLSKAWCMRVAAADATYSNITIVAKVKVVPAVVDSGTQAVTTPAKMIVRFETYQQPGLDSKDDVEALTSLMRNDVADIDGFKTFPLFTFYSLGKGVYGDAFRIRLNSSPQLNKENNFTNYRVEVLELENILSREEVFVGTTDPDSLSGSESLYIDDIINESVKASTRIGVHSETTSFTDIYDIYKTQVDPTTTVASNEFSLLTGTTKEGAALKGFEFDVMNPSFVSIDAPEGVPLVGGSDGSFEPKDDNQVTREAAIDAQYIRAFNGEIDPVIRSKRRAPAQFIVDAGYSNEVKRALISLINSRYDAFGLIDGGILNTVTDAIAFGESMKNIGDRIFSKEFQHYRIRDPFTGKTIPVTTTFKFIKDICNHFRSNGNQTPFTGEAYTLITDAIKNSIRPIVDADDSDNKEKLYNLRLNYYEAIAENTFIRGTQTTSQNIWSDLSEENNMHVLLEMKRDIEDMVGKLTYNFAEAEDRKMFTEDGARRLEKYQGKVRSVSIDFQMNKWEEERSILHCYMAVIFRTLAKRSIIEIDINKRV